MSEIWDHAILFSSRAADTPLDPTASWPGSHCDMICVCEQRGCGGLKGLAVPPCLGTIQSASLLVHHKSTLVGKKMRISLLVVARDSLAFYHSASEIYRKALPQVSVSVCGCVYVMAELWSCSLDASSLCLCPASLTTDAGSVASARRGRGLIEVVVGVNFN